MKNLLLVVLIFSAQASLATDKSSTTPWINNGWSISKELFDYIRNTVPKGETILEMGSGWASGELAKYYTVYSVEHDQKWLDKYPTHYIYAPIKNGWYDPEVLGKSLPKSYKLILVDGPPGTIGRYGFLNNLSLFNSDVIILIDDVNREVEHKLLVDLAATLKRSFSVQNDSLGKKFGIILP